MTLTCDERICRNSRGNDQRTTSGGERQNAQKSTGPCTAAGKAAVALNGIKHGLLSRECLLKGESETELVDFGKRLRAKLAPVGELELLLAGARILDSMEAAPPHRRGNALLFDREHSVDYAFNNSGREKMGVLSRYEVTLERSLYKALHELQRLQAARDGQAGPTSRDGGRGYLHLDAERGASNGFAWRKPSALQARKSKNQSAIKSNVKPIAWEIEWPNRRFCWP